MCVCVCVCVCPLTFRLLELFFGLLKDGEFFKHLRVIHDTFENVLKVSEKSLRAGSS